MKRLLQIFGLFFIVLFKAAAQEPINLAQHEALPLLGREIVFQKYQSPQKNQTDLNYHSNPGTWQDVRLVDWSPPIVTISGATGTFIRTEFVHIMSFPPQLRTKISELAPQAKAARDSRNARTLVLKDGRRLEEVTLQYAVPSVIHVSHSLGEEDIPLKLVESSYSTRHGLTGDSVYHRQVTLADGTVLDGARIVAVDPENIRIMHSAGSMPAKVQDIPPDVAKQVGTYLIAKNLFREESLSIMARNQKERAANAPRRAAVTPSPTPEPTPRPELVRKSEPFQYAQIPLNDGKRILHNVAIIGFSRDLVETDQGQISRRDIPLEVVADLSGLPYELLEKLLTSGLVARGRSPIFEAIRNPNNEKPFADATGGKMSGYVGTGYLVLSNRYRNYDGAVVALPKPLGDKQEAFVLVRDFFHMGEDRHRKWWNEYDKVPLPEAEDRWKLRFCPRPVDPSSVLLDPFEGKYTLFGNERGIMRNAWQIGSDLWSSYHIVETAQGYFLGRLSFKEGVVESTMTWPQLVTHRAMPFEIKKVSQKALKPGQAIIRLTDGDGSIQAAMTAFDPTNSQIRPMHYRRLIEQGLPGLLVLTQIPQTDGVETLREEGEAKDFAVLKESQIFRLVLEYVSETESTLLIKFEIQKRERTVERTRENGRVIVKELPWKNTKNESFVEMVKDFDGSVRLNDGQRIYEIQPSRVTDSQLIVYEIKANTLDKKTR